MMAAAAQKSLQLFRFSGSIGVVASVPNFIVSFSVMKLTIFTAGEYAYSDPFAEVTEEARLKNSSDLSRFTKR